MKKQRYFFISFVYRTKDNKHGYGSSSFKNADFPNLKTITDAIINELEGAQLPVVITNIFEFKSEEDYLNFST